MMNPSRFLAVPLALLLGLLCARTGASAHPSGGALAGERFRLIVSTDIGGSDPDDFQSMVHYLFYADLFDTEGLIASPPHAGRKQHILEVLDAYAADYSTLRAQSARFPHPDALRAITKQGAVDAAPPAGFSMPTEGSRWIIERARADDPRPLWILVWGSITDVAQALHDAPDIKPKLRVYFISSWNRRMDQAARDYVVQQHPDLWLIEAETTFRGMYVGGKQDDDLGNREFIARHVRGHGALGDLLAAKKPDIKMGDTPSVLYLLRGEAENPASESWGGAFVRPDPARPYWTDHPDPALREGDFAGAQTVNRWREDYLRDWQQRLAWLLSLGFPLHAAPRPNIVLVITDDQGYGDLGHTGNPVIKTPHLDRLAAESSNLTDYHVAPTCSPTRAALLTGHWTDRTGVWHTVNGRSMLRENEVTVGQMLKDAGYATGMFGKWHLGDNFPYRPEDRGFTEVYRHGGGGVGQTPDLWDNAYFDGHYFHNGRVVSAKGFCTDVFFAEAQRFIRECAARKQPFFAYIAPNAPHGPLHAPQKVLDLYAGQPPALAAFFGMISNIDDNVGAIRVLLRELGLERDTLLIFTTDNGTATGAKVFNAGMRGAKGSEYEGGHRVPFIAHWPAAGWDRKHASDILCHAVDIVPTLLEITGAKKPAALKFDGLSIRPLLDPAGKTGNWPHDRMLVTDSQRVRDPIQWKQTAVMSGKWRLVNGRELYDLTADPGQERNVIADHAAQAEKMRAFYDAWWAELEPTFAQTTEIHLGHPDHPVVSLTGHDWIQEALPPWNQQHIREADGYAPAQQGRQAVRASESPSKSVHRGHWAVKVVTSGSYSISLRRWPLEADQPITASLPPGADVPGATKAFRARPGVAIPAASATLRLNGKDVQSKPVLPGDKEVTFITRLTAGSHQLAPVFVDAMGNEIGAYYTIITKRP